MWMVGCWIVGSGSTAGSQLSCPCQQPLCRCGCAMHTPAAAPAAGAVHVCCWRCSQPFGAAIAPDRMLCGHNRQHTIHSTNRGSPPNNGLLLACMPVLLSLAPGGDNPKPGLSVSSCLSIAEQAAGVRLSEAADPCRRSQRELPQTWPGHHQYRCVYTRCGADKIQEAAAAAAVATLCNVSAARSPIR